MAGQFVFGSAEIERLLRQMPEKVAKKVTIAGLRAGARVLVKGMKARVPVRTGALRESITVSAAAKVTAGRGLVSVGFRKPVSRRAHLTEFGTEHSPAEPFIRPAIDQDGAEAIRAIGEALGRGIAREAGKLARG